MTSVLYCGVLTRPSVPTPLAPLSVPVKRATYKLPPPPVKVSNCGTRQEVSITITNTGNMLNIHHQTLSCHHKFSKIAYYLKREKDVDIDIQTISCVHDFQRENLSKKKEMRLIYIFTHLHVHVFMNLHTCTCIYEFSKKKFLKRKKLDIHLHTITQTCTHEFSWRKFESNITNKHFFLQTSMNVQILT